MDESSRRAVAESLERLAVLPDWTDEAWDRCYKLVSANSEDELVAWVYDDLIHCSAEPLMNSWRKVPKHPLFDSYRQEFRDVAEALRLGLSLPEFQRRYGY